MGYWYYFGDRSSTSQKKQHFHLRWSWCRISCYIYINSFRAWNIKYFFPRKKRFRLVACDYLIDWVRQRIEAISLYAVHCWLWEIFWRNSWADASVSMCDSSFIAKANPSLLWPWGKRGLSLFFSLYLLLVHFWRAIFIWILLHFAHLC